MRDPAANYSLEELSSLIAGVYDAALYPERWTQALDAIRMFVGGYAATLSWSDLTDNGAGVYFSSGDDLAYRKLYLEKYAAMNPLFPAVNFVEIGVVMGQFDVVPEKEFVETRFYREWVEPQDIVDNIAANLAKSPTCTSLISIIRKRAQGVVDDRARHRMALVVPHLIRAVSIGQLVAAKAAQKTSLMETLDVISSAVFLIDRDGRIVFSNAAGRTLIEDKRLIRASNGVLSAVDHRCDQALQDALASASLGDEKLGIKGLAVPLLESSDERWFAHVLPLTSGARKDSHVVPSATAAVFIRESKQSAPSALETLSKLHRLTAVEMRVLQAIVDIGGVPDVAAKLGIAPATVKSHLASLFNKTGVRRQADLVKLVAGATSPF